MILQLEILDSVPLLHVLFQRQIGPECPPAELTRNEVYLPDNHRNGPVDDSDELGVRVAAQVGHESLVTNDGLHADLTPVGGPLTPLILLVTPEMADKVLVPVTVELAHLALEGGLVHDVLDVVQDNGLCVRVTNGSVDMIVGHEVLPILVS